MWGDSAKFCLIAFIALPTYQLLMSCIVVVVVIIVRHASIQGLSSHFIICFIVYAWKVFYHLSIISYRQIRY